MNMGLNTDLNGGQRRGTLLARAKHIWLHVDDLAWFIKVMRHQYNTGGVPPVPMGEASTFANPHNHISWSFRDSAWVCRAKYDGRTYVKTLAIARRAKHGHNENEAGGDPGARRRIMKEVTLGALCEWQRLVEAGGDPGVDAMLADADDAGADAEAAAAPAGVQAAV